MGIRLGENNMGGITITRTEKDPNKLLYEICAEIQKSFPNLQPDSSIILFNPTTKKSKVYKFEFTHPYGETFIVKPIRKLGRGGPCAIQVSANYRKKPEKNEWIGMVHLHT